MLIGCTKNLLEFLKETPVEREEAIDPLYSWTANLIMLNRRKTLVAVNDATKCCFVLHGLTTKMIPKLPELLKNGIRAVLESEYVAPNIIEKYLDECGQELVFTKTLRSEVAYCNKACERVKSFSEILIPGDLLQKPFLPWFNDDLIPKYNYHRISEILISAFSERYGSPVQSAQMVELEVELELCTPCKRTLLVPTNLNFYQLHRILQDAFGWEDHHMHQFILEKKRSGRPTKVIQPFGGAAEFFLDKDIQNIESTEITVKEVFALHKKIEYEYDFGDDWMHTVKLKKWIENFENPYPTCIDAVGEAPLEDCGGRFGFKEKLEILADSKHPDYQEIMDWTGGKCTKPLDMKRINCRIADAYRRCIPVIYS
jgi:hypothetical protein